jgi:hypothetical protein
MRKLQMTVALEFVGRTASSGVLSSTEETGEASLN